jgi:hypothetical protein
MTADNIIQPITRSELISSLGAVKGPWVISGSGLFIGVLMLGYTRPGERAPTALASHHPGWYGRRDARVLDLLRAGYADAEIPSSIGPTRPSAPELDAKLNLA